MTSKIRTLTLGAAVLFAWFLVAGGLAEAATIACDGSILDCTPCCGSAACTCSDSRQCTVGGFFNAVADNDSCYRTGVKIENSNGVAVQVRLRYDYCVGVCFNPVPHVTTTFWMDPNEIVSQHIDDFFPFLDDTDGWVTITVLQPSGKGVSMLRSDTDDCTHYVIDKVDACTEAS